MKGYLVLLIEDRTQASCSIILACGAILEIGRHRALFSPAHSSRPTPGPTNSALLVVLLPCSVCVAVFFECIARYALLDALRLYLHYPEFTPTIKGTGKKVDSEISSARVPRLLPLPKWNTLRSRTEVSS
ncbi:hypothetical protein HMN09_01102000 [Mycena chlorophos]|uniref:Uncharacterized protein n=1 Tax=Mycena chlorophos TaxID=658473 RepID=A0A8H6SDJ2_MYCCL|nr:hypothetical protein HMN09_01102000 [Mycena chlorophos]